MGSPGCCSSCGAGAPAAAPSEGAIHPRTMTCVFEERGAERSRIAARGGRGRRNRNRSSPVDLNVCLGIMLSIRSRGLCVFQSKIHRSIHPSNQRLLSPTAAARLRSPAACLVCVHTTGRWWLLIGRPSEQSSNLNYSPPIPNIGRQVLQPPSSSATHHHDQHSSNPARPRLRRSHAAAAPAPR